MRRVIALILLPDEEEEVQVKRSDLYISDLFDNYDLLEYEALRITGNLPESQKRGKKWRPRGRVRVYDNNKRGWSISSVNVPTKNWFRWWDGYTDNRGKFHCPKGYYGKVSYSLRWQYPHNRFDIRNGDRRQAYFNGPKQKDFWNCKIGSEKSWMYAHIFRAGSFYVGQEPFGLKDRPLALPIIVTESSSCILGLAKRRSLIQTPDGVKSDSCQFPVVDFPGLIIEHGSGILDNDQFAHEIPLISAQISRESGLWEMPGFSSADVIFTVGITPLIVLFK